MKVNVHLPFVGMGEQEFCGNPTQTDAGKPMGKPKLLFGLGHENK